MLPNRDRRTILLLSVVSVFLTRYSFGLDAPVDVRRFPVSAGDTLIIQMDYGRVNVHPHPSAELEAHLTKQAKTARQFDNIEILGQKQGDKIYLNSYFYSYQGESVSAEIWAPPDLNIVVWGANPDVQIAGMSGYVRIYSLTGAITADDLTASAALMTDSGNIVFRARKQPGGDVRMESVTGNILCELKDDLNFRGWARAGGNLNWNGEVEMDQGSLERQIGLGGPLCYASSLKGQVQFRVRSQLAERPPEPQPPVLSSLPARSESRVEGRAPTTETTVMVPAPGQAQTSSQGPVSRDASGTYSTGYKLKLDVDWIYLNASVRERKTNRSVPNLQKSDFQLYEDGTPQEIGRFMQTEEPFHLLLLIDVSGSTQSYLDLIQDACIQFTRQIGPKDQVAVATFNSRYRLRQDFTGDREQAVRAIGQIRSGGGTAMYDALLEAVDYISRIQGRKAIVLFSDGVDNQLEGNAGDGSRATFPQLYRQIQEADALIYTIFLDTEESQSLPGRSGGGVIDILGDILRGGGVGGRRPARYPRRPVRNRAAYAEAREQMEMIAEQTGARMYAPTRTQDLSHAYSEIADDLRVQYTLGYNSTNTNKDGTWRKVRVAVVNRPDLVVRTRKGYYAAQQRATTPTAKPGTATANLTSLGP
jgi:Ca-activated chloride channel family protein